MTTKQRFEAAVNVIRNLPKNGSYQPSNSLMLDFYAYYKQATEGWDRRSRPAFWDVVGRAKWDAWNRLGEMSSEEAMQRYIDELNKVTEKIVETMALTDSVAEFLQSMETYPGDPEDLELCIGPLLERVRSQHGTPNDSQETTPSRKADTHSTTPSQVSDAEEEEEDEFVDTLPPSTVKEDHHAPAKRKDTPMVMPVASSQLLTHANHVETRLPNGYTHLKQPQPKGVDPVSEALQKAIESLRRDLTLANEKVRALEERQNMVSRNKHPLFGTQVTPGTVAFVVLWPIFIHYFLSWLSRRRHR